MKKGISFYFGYVIDIEKRAEMIKNAGFDYVMTNQDPRFDEQNGTIETQIELFKKYDLGVSSLHNQYKTSELHNFWLDNEVGDKLEKQLIDDIEVAGKYGFRCVVVHTIGEYSKIGENRLQRVLKVCEEQNVPIAIENIDFQHPLIEIFENISHPYLKFCYDSGHNNCFDPDFDYLEKYGDKLICFHLHDNNGKADEHTLNKFGTINWEKIAKKISKLDLSNISLDYEMIMNNKNNTDENECLDETIKQANELEKMILFYKNEN